MNHSSYEKSMDKSIIEIKIYVLLLIEGTYKQEIHEVINNSIDIKQLQRNIKRRQDISLLLFMKIKKALDEAETLQMLEEHLVYMNILLDPLFSPVVSYKYNLFQYLMKQQDFDLQTYCILRHLIQFKNHRLPEFIDYMCNKDTMSQEEYHLLASEIFCLEHLYDDAYEHVSFVGTNTNLERYKLALYKYSPHKYKKIIQTQRKGLLRLIFNR